MQNEAKFLTITQAAEFLKVSPDTLRRWEDKGIVSPQRTRGNSRRYTLLDLKIAKLNKKKIRLFQIPAFLKQNYINSGRDFKIALLTSFLWIFGFLIYHFLTPVFLRPTNPDQQIFSDSPAGKTGQLKIASETNRLKISALTSLSLPNIGSIEGDKIAPEVISLGSDLLNHQLSNAPALQYTETLDQYYSLQPLPQTQITTLIKRN